MARLVIENESDLEQAEAALLALETVAYELSGWFIEESGIGEVTTRIQKAVDRYERQQERLGR